jgi:hypothetical protein
MAALGGRARYSSYSFLTLALDGVSGHHHAPATLCPGKWPPVPIVQETGWAPELVWTQRLEEKSMVTWHGLSCIQPSAIKLSSVHFASTFTVSRGDEGTEAGGPLHAPALSRFPMLGPWRRCQGSNPDRPVAQSVVRHCTDWATRLL